MLIILRALISIIGMERNRMMSSDELRQRAAHFRLIALDGEDLHFVAALLPRDNQGENRIASSRNAPERVGHCLSRMLPARGYFVNRVPGRLRPVTA